MRHSQKALAGVAAVLVALLAVACAGQPTTEQTTAPPEQTSQVPAEQAAPMDQGAAAAPAEGTVPAPEQAPAQGEQPQN